MVGIFDSGAGGELALQYLRGLRRNADIAFFADRRNAPYGTKSREELIGLVMRDIDILREHGATDILMACCTASTVYSELPENYREGVIPIICATAEYAVRSSVNKAIGVIATEATVRSGAFESELRSFCGAVRVLSHAAPELVSAIESKKGVDSVLLERELAFLDGGGTDTVILGCTHFAAIESEIRKRGYNTVNSARIGAEMLACRAAEGRGVTLYINK